MINNNGNITNISLQISDIKEHNFNMLFSRALASMT